MSILPNEPEEFSAEDQRIHVVAGKYIETALEQLHEFRANPSLINPFLDQVREELKGSGESSDSIALVTKGVEEAIKSTIALLRSGKAKREGGTGGPGLGA